MSRNPKEKMNNLFRQAVGCAYDIRRLIFLSIGFYLSGVLVGITFPQHFSELLDSFRLLATHFRERSPCVLILMIFLQNCGSALLSIWLGIVLGIVPFISAVANGILTGIVFSLGIQSNLIKEFCLLLPHGLFELPAIFISWALGLWMGAWPFRKDRHQTFFERAKRVSSVFVVFVLPLLIVAAIIEGLLISIASSH